MKFIKSHYLFLIFSLFLFSFIDGNKKMNDWEKEHLNGKVKSIREYNYNKPIILNLSDTNYDLIIIYNKKGNQIEWNWNKGDEKGNKKIITYNKSGNIIDETISDKNGKVILKDTYKYDNKRNLSEDNICLQYSGEDTTRYMDKYKCDNLGNKIEKDFYDKGIKYEGKNLYKYDEKRNLIEDDDYDKDEKLIRKNIFKYDEKGNLIENDFYEHGVDLTEKWIWKYDNYGNITEQYRYDSFNKLMTNELYKYDYDKNGNWIKSIGINEQKTTFTNIRIIEYY